MALKTFNINEKVYKQFSRHCKEHGISMSKKIEKFIQKEIEQIKFPEKKEIGGEEQHPLRKYC